MKKLYLTIAMVLFSIVALSQNPPLILGLTTKVKGQAVFNTLIGKAFLQVETVGKDSLTIFTFSIKQDSRMVFFCYIEKGCRLIDPMDTRSILIWDHKVFALKE